MVSRRAGRMVAQLTHFPAKDEPGLPHEAFMAVLDAEDSGQPAG